MCVHSIRIVSLCGDDSVRIAFELCGLETFEMIILAGSCQSTIHG